MDGDQFARAAYLGLLILALAGWALFEFRGRLGQGLRMAMAWGFIFVATMAGYGLWKDLGRDGMLSQIQTNSGEMELRRARDGHFYADLTINGEVVRFMADTGATDMVLSQEDAARLGFSASELHYLGEASTANGVVRTARVTLDEIRFGPFTDYSLPAYVNEGTMDISLLGMAYLRRFKIQIDGDAMLLSR